MPAMLYKFRADDPFTPKVISDRKIWLATPATLNDPLECKTGKIPDDIRQKTIREMEIGQVMGVIGQPLLPEPQTLFSLTPRQTRQWIKRFKAASHDNRVKMMRALYGDHGVTLSNPKQLFETLSRQLSEVGIFSLTDNVENQPMWSHYAGDHTGLALGFMTTSGSKLADSAHTIQVNYTDIRPAFDGQMLSAIQFFTPGAGTMASQQTFQFKDPTIRASISTKPSGWSYESEWRYVEPKGGLYDYPGPLTSVVFGLKMAEQRRDFYRELLTKSGFSGQLHETHVSEDGEFKVVKID